MIDISGRVGGGLNFKFTRLTSIIVMLWQYDLLLFPNYSPSQWCILIFRLYIIGNKSLKLFYFSKGMKYKGSHINVHCTLSR